MSRIIYFKTDAGVSGDMFVGSLIDLGVPLETLQGALQRLDIEGVELRAKRVKRAGVDAVKFSVIEASTGADIEAAKGRQPQRGLPEIVEIIKRGSFSPVVEEGALSIFEKLAEAESRVHQVPVEQLHFHEVGAIDAIVDVLCACIGLNWLEVDECCCLPPVLGAGEVTCAHGVIPVPAPATLEILSKRPFRNPRFEKLPGELTTPTGAALLDHFCEEFSAPTTFTQELVGYGAGGRELDFPNVLCATLGSL
ncbi:MAG: hypothetical protein C0608_05315 [Deltaproteobacteria bacterium]|nr:MAG: hypothetical protein C0608_05315 [Deltaproteobacteria bacterium]